MQNSGAKLLGQFENNLPQMGPGSTKPVFGISDKARLKPVSSATEISYEISLVASLDMILSNKQISKALIRLPERAGWSSPLLLANPKDRFSRVEAQMVLPRVTLYRDCSNHSEL